MTDAPLSDEQIRVLMNVVAERRVPTVSDMQRLCAQAREANRLREREAEVRRETVEECARVADTFPLQTLRTYEGEGGVPRTYMGETKPKDVAEAIRSLARALPPDSPPPAREGDKG